MVGVAWGVSVMKAEMEMANKRGKKKGCVKMTMKCKYMEESRKNINLSLLHQITKATNCTQIVCVLPVTRVFSSVLNIHEVRSITARDQK